MISSTRRSSRWRSRTPGTRTTSCCTWIPISGWKAIRIAAPAVHQYHRERAQAFRGRHQRADRGSGECRHRHNRHECGEFRVSDSRRGTFRHLPPVRQGRSGPGTESGGTGIGLSIARWAAQLHGGTVRVVDDPRGADFEIVLPKYHIADDEPATDGSARACCEPELRSRSLHGTFGGSCATGSPSRADRHRDGSGRLPLPRLGRAGGGLQP